MNAIILKSSIEMVHDFPHVAFDSPLFHNTVTSFLNESLLCLLRFFLAGPFDLMGTCFLKLIFSIVLNFVESSASPFCSYFRRA